MSKTAERTSKNGVDESATESRRQPIERCLSALAIVLALYMFYATVFGPYRTTIVHLSIYLGVMLVIYFLSEMRSQSAFGRILDWALAIGAGCSALYLVIDYERMGGLISASAMTRLDMVAGITLIIASVEAARRQSVAFCILAIIGSLYTVYGWLFPGAFAHPGVSPLRFIYLNAFGPEGIFGLGLSVATEYLFTFILMGTAFRAAGTTDFIVKLSNALFGRMMGGAGKASILASIGLGTVIGSPVAGAALVGSVTIPNMQRAGYRPEVAAAIETVNAEGAQLVPPILGAAAFIMVELTGISYLTVATAAIVPALLYYLSMWVLVDLEARKAGAKPMGGFSRSEILLIATSGIHLLVPILLLFILIFSLGFTAAYAGMACFGASIIVAQLRRQTRFGWKKILTILDTGTREAAKITGFVVALGLVQQALTVTGLGVRLTDLLLGFAGNDLLVTLAIGAAVSLVLGMGLPTPLAYTLAAVSVAPAINEAGVPLIAAHFFVFFFAIKSGSTPPIAVVAMVTAAIAKADWLKTANLSFVYSIPGWLTAFAFAFAPALLLIQPFSASVAWLIATTALAVVTATVALAGWMNGLLPLWQRVFLALVSACLISTSFVFSMLGFGGFLLAACYRYIAKPRTAML